MRGIVVIDEEEMEVEFPLYRRLNFTGQGGGKSTTVIQTWPTKDITLTHDVDGEYDEWTLVVGPPSLSGDYDFVLGDGQYSAEFGDWCLALAEFNDFVCEELG